MIARQLGQRLGAVDGRAQPRAALEALRVPGAQRAQLVDHPAVVARSGALSRLCGSPARRAGSPPARGRARSGAARCSRAETARALRARPGAPARPSSRSCACARIHGFRSTPRPTKTPLTPCRSRSTICSGSMQSPDPNTGIVSASATLRDEVPVGGAAVGLLGGAPVDGDRRGAGVLDAPGDVRRVDLVVVPALAHLDGDRNAHGLHHRRDDRAPRARGSRIRLQPALCFAIFGTGQPMLTSTMLAPMPSTMRAASAMRSGSPPKI